jgi:hypothetical protein
LKIAPLSAPLTYLSPKGRSSIARWMLSLRDFMKHTSMMGDGI